MMEEPLLPPDIDGHQSGPGPSEQGDGGKDDPNRRKPGIRKRTKTGCLTCRKRRIKCDEGRPTCNNCIKSKRQCEGYNRRVVFKEPFASNPYPESFGPVTYLQGTHPLSDFAAQQVRSGAQGPLPTIAPKPPGYDLFTYPNGAYGHGQLGRGGPPVFDFTPPAYPHGLYTTTPHHLIPEMVPSLGLSGQQPLPLPIPGTNEQQYYLAGEASSASFNNAMGVSPSGPASQMQPSMQSIQRAFESDDEYASLEESDDENKKNPMVMAPGGYLTMAIDNATQIRSFAGNAQSEMLSEYMSFPHVSELKDEAKRVIFEHFIKVTGPSMSLYERYPFDPSESEVVDPSGDGSNIWSYTFPVISFQHPGLLHAMLAMASLQISKLQGSPSTVAMKHYHIALRRVAKNVRSTLRRTHPATIAATLLLGYFEVWNSEHTMWCNHLYGARSLFAEVPLRDMSRRCLPVKSLKERQKLMKKMGFASIGSPIPKDPSALDFDLLTAITGINITPDDYGLREDQVLSTSPSSATDKDIANFENLRDLFWWYCKMDVYQSLLGGTKLFMDYEKWTQCPPRAPASKLGGVYGAYDHLMLLLGRLTSYQSKDVARKRMAHRARAGSSSENNSPPSFPGMLPNMGGFRAPMGFSPPRNSPPSENLENTDLEASLKVALEEWENIRHAFSLYESHLGPEFKALSAEYTDRRERPFGPALQYRTFSVAGIWLNYYMGLISLHRSHPSMPPTAMQSVGLSARETAGYANTIGRIAVGMFDGGSHVTEVSTVSAAALIESAICLFVASVQYQDEEQRKWVVGRLHEITRLTGWQSAQQIAEGCESSWTKAAQLGRGPPYERTVNLDTSKDSVWKTARRIDRRIQEVENGEERRVVLARSERAHYALGLLGVEDDLEYLDLGDNPFSRSTMPIK